MSRLELIKRITERRDDVQARILELETLLIEGQENYDLEKEYNLLLNKSLTD